MVVLWVVLAAALLIGEALTGAFFAIFLAIGAAGAAVSAALDAPVWVQLIAMAGLPVLGIFAVRPALVRSTHRHALPGAGSHQSMVGRNALTLDQVGNEHHPGHVLYAGERWLATTETPEGLPANTPVTIVAVKGTTLEVWP